MILIHKNGVIKKEIALWGKFQLENSEEFCEKYPEYGDNCYNARILDLCSYGVIVSKLNRIESLKSFENLVIDKEIELSIFDSAIVKEDAKYLDTCLMIPFKKKKRQLFVCIKKKDLIEMSFLTDEERLFLEVL